MLVSVRVYITCMRGSRAIIRKSEQEFLIPLHNIAEVLADAYKGFLLESEAAAIAIEIKKLYATLGYPAKQDMKCRALFPEGARAVQKGHVWIGVKFNQAEPAF